MKLERIVSDGSRDQGHAPRVAAVSRPLTEAHIFQLPEVPLALAWLVVVASASERVGEIHL